MSLNKNCPYLNKEPGSYDWSKCGDQVRYIMCGFSDRANNGYKNCKTYQNKEGINAEYDVEIKQINTYWVNLHADSEEEAKKKAHDMYVKDKTEYFDDSDCKIEAHKAK